MSLELLEPGGNLGLARGDAAVGIPVHGAWDRFAECMRSVLRHTPPEVPVFVVDDGSPDPAIRRLCEELGHAAPNRLVFTRQEPARGFVATANLLFAASAPGDVLLVNSDCVVAEGWFEGMRDAAYVDARVATASALTNSGTILSLPKRNVPAQLPQNWQIDRAADAVRETSLRLRPQLPAAIGHCAWFRRSALDLAGSFDEAFSPGYEEEVDFSQRCLLLGLTHVTADDVFVQHYGGSSFNGNGSGAAELLRTDHHEIIKARYPYYGAWVDDVASDAHAPLARALGAARRGLRGLSVTIDGRILVEFLTGTQVHVLEVIAALHALGDVRLRVVVPPDLGSYAVPLLHGMKDLELLRADEVRPGIEKTDVAHRPFQVFAPNDLELLQILGDRLVVTQQDLIAYHNPGYVSTYEEWDDQRRLTRTVLSAADQVAFFSRYTADQAVAEELVEPRRAKAVRLGTDHRLAAMRPAPVEPPGAEAIAGRPFLLSIGTDFIHKNRLFAIRMFEALRERHGWDGLLVFAGARVRVGGSAGAEAAYLATRPGLQDAVLDLAAVDEAGKEWLLRRANALVYPSTTEGFGLVPFEAAEAGVPCLFASVASLAEMLPASAALIEPWDAELSADRAIEVLREGRERDDHIRLLRASGARLTWRRAAEQLVEVYRAAADQEVRPARKLAHEHLELQARHEELEREHEELERRFDELYYPGNELDAGLVGPRGFIDWELRRALLGIGYRRWLRILVVPPIRLLYRVAYTVRHGHRPRADSTEEST